MMWEPLGVLMMLMRTGNSSFSSSMWVMTRMRSKSPSMECMALTSFSRPYPSWMPKPSSITSVCNCVPARLASSLLNAMRTARFTLNASPPLYIS